MNNKKKKKENFEQKSSGMFKIFVAVVECVYALNGS